jgi:FeS assembly SUF system protein
MDRTLDKQGMVGAVDMDAPAQADDGQSPAVANALEARVVVAMESVYDPEIPVNIYELGLIYNVDISPSGDVAIEMTLTSPACPVAGELPGEVETRVREVDGVSEVVVELVWDPPWTPDRMTEAARLELGMM